VHLNICDSLLFIVILNPV